MAESNEAQRKRGAQSIAELIGRIIDPLTKKRGFATADLVAAWPDIAGSRFAAVTRPAKIVWPRGEANDGAAGVLTLHVEGPSAILVQKRKGRRSQSSDWTCRRTTALNRGEPLAGGSRSGGGTTPASNRSRTV